MRPVIQKAVVRAASLLVTRRVLTWEQALERLSKLPWKIKEAPWSAVFNPATGGMIGGKENVELLDDLLEVHLAPPSKQAVLRARKRYKDVRGIQYPVAEAELVAAVDGNAPEAPS